MRFAGSNAQMLTAALAMMLFAPLPSRSQEPPPNAPATALSEALAAACRQNETEFQQYLTAANAEAFRDMEPSLRTKLMQRLVLLEQPGRPLFSTDAQGHPVVRCDTPSLTSEIQLGRASVQENLAFIPIVVTGGRHVRMGLVREGGRWKLLSVGILLLDLPTLELQWKEENLETREATAIRDLRQLAKSLETYQRAFGKLPESLKELGPAGKEGISPDAASLVDAELAEGKKDGYVFRYRIVPATDEKSQPGFELAAVPLQYGKTGRRSFFLDSSGVLRGADKQGAVATPLDPRVESR